MYGVVKEVCVCWGKGRVEVGRRDKKGSLVKIDKEYGEPTVFSTVE